MDDTTPLSDCRLFDQGRLNFLSSIVLLMRRTMTKQTVQQQFALALSRLTEQLKLDRSILAAILCGSLSYDKVWAKSDIDLVLVTIDDKIFKDDRSGLSLYADDVNVHAFTISRSQFRTTV